MPATADAPRGLVRGSVGKRPGVPPSGSRALPRASCGITASSFDPGAFGPGGPACCACLRGSAAAQPHRALLGAAGGPPTKLRLIGPKRSHRKARRGLLGSTAFTLTEPLHIWAIDQVVGAQVQHAARQGCESVIGGFEIVGQLAVIAATVLVDRSEQRLDEIGPGRTRSQGGSRGQLGEHVCVSGLYLLQAVLPRQQRAHDAARSGFGRQRDNKLGTTRARQHLAI